MIKFKNILLQESTFPSGWNFDTFNSLKTFKSRKDYCDTLIKKIGQGSGRIVYNIDNQYVLKVAKNIKGVAQNKQEFNFLFNNDLGRAKRYFAQIEGADENNYWIISEYCPRPNASQFKEKVGCSFKDFEQCVTYLFMTNRYGKFSYSIPERYKEIRSGGYSAKLLLIFNEIKNKVSLADLTKITSYGINKEGNIVIVDYGLTDEIYKTYYDYDRN